MSDGSSLEATPERAWTTPSWAWAVTACIVAFLPVANGLTASRIFHVRDLGKFFWPYHVWMTATVAAGRLPLWDPSAGCGYAAAVDPTLHVFFAPTLPLRLLLPPALGFNLSIAASLPAAALGAFAFVRRSASPPAAALGAVVFAASGCVVTAANTPNLVWSVALVPWVLWATDAAARNRSVRTVAALGLAVGIQILAGEPVTLVATAAVAVAYAAARDPKDGGGWQSRLAAVGVVAVGGLVGLLVGAVVFFPLVGEVARSARASADATNEWSLHPLALVEALAPSVFGSVLEPVGTKCSWYRALNEGREPLFLSIYVGAPAIALAALGLREEPRRRAVFWAAVAVIALVCALGDWTPLLPFLRAHVPLVGDFRYPAKFFVFVALALAVLAATGWDALSRRCDSSPALVVCLAAAGAAVVAWLVASASQATLVGWSASLGLPNPAVEGQRLATVLATVAPRVLLIAGLAASLMWFGGREHRRSSLARYALVALVAADLTSAAMGKNPTLDVSLFTRPAWSSAVEPGSRLFVSSGRDLDHVPVPYLASPIPPALSTATVSSVYDAVFPSAPVGLGLPTPIELGVARLRPIEYERAVERYHVATPTERRRFLDRAGVRYYVVLAPPGDLRPLERIPDFDGVMGLYESSTAEPRAAVVTAYRVEPDRDQRIESALFAEGSRDAVVLADEPPPAAVDGAASSPAATIVVDDANAIVLRASAPAGGGFLVLRDAYDVGWQAEVDGSPAPVLPADSIFRAVRIGPGEHTVAMRYVPTPLYVGAVVSSISLAVLIGLASLRRASAKEPRTQ